MKFNIGRWAVVILMSLLMLNCSSIRARNDISANEWTVYPGIKKDIKETGELFGGKRSESGWVKGLITSFLIIDLPFSAVFDTIVAPYDLYRINASESTVERGKPQNGLGRDKAP
ncbi:MAG: YceK/YidQ family lipoprotein [Methylococcales bacterium]|nr:YceK/YidQ family lipoprotein [Methylococcales bacterium]